MESGGQISDNGLVVFGYGRDTNFDQHSSRWTSSGGFQILGEPIGYTQSALVARGISADGSISVGDMFRLDSNLNYSSYQAYRWTTSGGMVGLGYLPGGARSASLAISSNGTTILGVSTSTGFSGPPGQYPNDGELFLWTAANGIKSLGKPEGFEFYYVGGGGLNSDATLAAISVFGFGSNSFIVQTASKLFFDLQDALAQAGAGAAIAGWSDFPHFRNNG